MFSKFNEKSFPKGALYILEVLGNSNHKAYLVGGCVRDLLLKKKPKEFDITTSALPEVCQKLFKKVVPTGIDFGTVTIILDDGQYETTTFRSDERYTDGRHPEKVTFTKSINEDLSRRDFTVNAMAYNPLEKEFIDIFEGEKDLKKKLIRAVGAPIERFNEDGLRSIRACRFAAKLNFNIEEETFNAIPKTLDKTKMVAPERIHDELMKIMEADKPSIAIEYMRQTDLLKLIMPELEEGIGCEQPKPFHKYDVYWHSLYSCDLAPKEKPLLRIASLLHDIAKPRCKKEMTFYDHDQMGASQAEDIMKRLKFSNADIKYAMNLIKNHMFNYESNWSDSAVRRFMRRVGVENLEDLFLLRKADVAAMEREIGDEYLKELKGRIKKILEEENALHVNDLKVDGNDIMKLVGIGPGPEVGKILNFLLEKVLDDPSLNEKDKLLELAKKYRQE